MRILLLFGALAASLAAAEKPNIVILLADDLGWGDVSYHGGEIRTPRIDGLAAEGVQLDRFYSFPVCSPTRAGLMTGRYPIRYGAMRTVFPPWRKGGLDTSEVTLADVLGAVGYGRRGVFGKWHLGHSDVKYHPLRRGFTDFYGHYNGAIDYFTHEREGVLDWHRGFATNHDEGYSTDLIARRAAEFIHDAAAGGAPFLCYVPFNAPHSPFQAKPEDMAPYQDLEAIPGDRPSDSPEAQQAAKNIEQRRKNRRILAGMIAGLDRGVGRVLDAVAESGVHDNTLVLFFSDNGGVAGIGSNKPLRGDKATVFEGGTRVPAAIRWPAVLEGGGRKVESPIGVIDVLPTLMSVAGVDDHGGKPLDGLNVWPLIAGEQQQIDRELYSYIGARGEDTEQVSYRDGDWKLVVTGPNLANPKADNSKRKRLLFRLDRDPNEQNDLAAEEPQRVAAMFAKAKAFRELQPADGVPPYSEGQNEPFTPPAEWRMPDGGQR
jgi:arylsulfatase B